MKAKPYKNTDTPDFTGLTPCEAADATHVELHMPGPIETVILPVVHGNTTRAGTRCWSWNGDTERPTFKPSLANTHHSGQPDEIKSHVWITDGKVKFLPDSTHDLAGQTLDLLDVE